MKNEYDIDLLDVKHAISISRYEEKKDVNLPLYEIWYNYSPSIRRLVSCYLINGTNGETLFTIKRYLGDKKGSLLDNYLDSLKNEEQKKSAVFRTYEGKIYTEEQWKIKEEELWNQYTQKHNLRTAIDIEKERNKKGGGFFLHENEKE